MTSIAQSVGEDFPRQQARVREILGHFKAIGPAGMFGAALIERILQRADAAQASGDIIKILVSYNELIGVKE